MVLIITNSKPRLCSGLFEELCLFRRIGETLFSGIFGVGLRTGKARFGFTKALFFVLEGGGVVFLLLGQNGSLGHVRDNRRMVSSCGEGERETEHSFFELILKSSGSIFFTDYGGFETTTGEQWLAFRDYGKYSTADYAKLASERVSRDREGSS